MEHHCTLLVNLPRPLKAYVVDVGSLYTAFAKLLDLRKAQGKHYPLVLVLILFVLAKLCGKEKPYSIAQWIQHRTDTRLLEHREGTTRLS